MARKKHNPRVGSDFEDFLAEEGQLEVRLPSPSSACSRGRSPRR